MTVQRTEEIGIRKVLGASISRIWLLLTRDFLILIGISFVIALPLSIWIINIWLESFASKMNFNAWLFILPFIILGLVTLATISTNVLRASSANPVDVLKYE